MNDTHCHPSRIVEENRHAIRREHSYRDARHIGNQGIGRRNGIVVAGGSSAPLSGGHTADIVPVNLFGRSERSRIETEGIENQLPVFENVDGVVSGVEAGIEILTRRSGPSKVTCGERRDDSIEWRLCGKCVPYGTQIIRRQF